jgi:hypothetical protein
LENNVKKYFKEVGCEDGKWIRTGSGLRPVFYINSVNSMGSAARVLISYFHNYFVEALFLNI